MMKDQPFIVSPSAAAYIQEELRSAAQCPQLAGLVPVLGVYSNATAWTEKDGVTGHISGGHFAFGWDPPDRASDCDCFRVAGMDFVIDPEAMERLRGANLEVEEAANNGPFSRWL